MTQRVDLGPADQLREGRAMLVTSKQAGTKGDITVVHAEEGGFFALDDECSHEAVSLSEGFVEEDTLECPKHASAFCLRTGEPETLPAITAVTTHLVTVEEGQLILYPGTPHPEA